MLYSHNAYPRGGLFEPAFHIMSYLKGRNNLCLPLEPIYPTIDREKFKDDDWMAFCGHVNEAISTIAPMLLGKSVDLQMMVDGNHKSGNLTRRSHNIFLIFYNKALINWLSKNQQTVESAVFGAGLVAMNHIVKTLCGLWYKLRMMGVPIEDPHYINGNNMSAIYNTLRPESVARKE